tara:strand:+ start:776 stop:1015 length:240 start_codon:yes stop_codon:yes gene_type:complete
MSLSENLEAVLGILEHDLDRAIDDVDSYLSSMADGYTKKDFEDQDEDDIDDFALYSSACANDSWLVISKVLRTLMEVCE